MRMRWLYERKGIAAFIVVFGAIGLLTLSRGFSASPVASRQAEDGVLSGPVRKFTDDNSASAGSYVRFGPAATDSDPKPPISGNWELTLREEFDGNSLNSSLWSTCYIETCAPDYNGEVQLYTADPKNVSVSGGTLKLTARKENATYQGKSFNYTSAVITTNAEMGQWSSPAKWSMHYGYIEARLKVPAGRGYFPAFWMIPADQSYPPEIDIMENLGHEPNRVYFTYHYGPDHNNVTSRGGEWIGPNFTSDFHTFGVDWTADRIIWYVDGVERYRYSGPGISTKPLFVLLNLAVGGEWGGYPDGSTPFPGTMEVDYVRAWKRI